MDERLVVRQSPIEGRGLFFTDQLTAGTIVIRLGGRLVSSAELDALIRDADADPAAPHVDTITVYDNVHLVLPPSTPIHFGNHSCDPTLWHVGPFNVATRRCVTASWPREQLPPSPLRTRRPTTDQPAVTNLTAEYI
jgi:hypothetical protein